MHNLNIMLITISKIFTNDHLLVVLKKGWSLMTGLIVIQLLFRVIIVGVQLYLH